jgi:glutamate/aspartate transport system substrate-binding protein
MIGKFISLLCLLVFFSASRAQELTGTLRKIKHSKNITLGYRFYSSPFSFVDTLGLPVGYAKDLCDRIAVEIKERLKLPDLSVKYYPVTPRDRVTLVQNGIVDMECGSTSVSLERKETVSFSIPYFVTDIRILSRVDSGITSIDDLKEKRVVITMDTTLGERVSERISNKAGNTENMIPHYERNHAESLMMVKTGFAVAFIMDDVILASLLANSKDPRAYTISDESLDTECYAIMLRKGDEMMKKFVDEALEKLMRSGEAEKIYNQWFLRPIPPRDVNLNLPMSVELRRVFSHHRESLNGNHCLPR